jgi:hypothetical protein
MESNYAIDVERSRSLGEILGAALSVYRRYPVLFAVLALGVMAPYDLGVLAITGSAPLGGGASRGAGVLFVLSLLRLSLIGPLVSALHMSAVMSIGRGETPRVGPVAMRGLLVLPIVAAAEIVASLGIAVGFAALIVPGVLLSLRWAVVAQAAAVDREGWMPSLRRSGELTDGHYGHVFGLLAVTGVLSFAVRLGARAILAGNASGFASVLLGVAVDTVLASFVALTLALLYLDLNARLANPPSVRRQAREYGHLRDLD